MSGQISSAAAARADMAPPRNLAERRLSLVVLALIALAMTELALVLAVPGTNYSSADGKAAQATILATLEFARPFSITNLNPLQGLGSQMMPMNVWVNPAYWPFAFFDKELASEISGIIAFICYAAACYAMARCFDVARVPSVLAAQFSIMLFTPVVLILAFAPNFVSIPGLAVVYAPHLVAFGLLARLSPERPQVLFVAGALLGLLFYSLYCDPLWTAVSGLAWIVPFAVVTFSPLRRDTILTRCAVLGGCVAILLLSGALEYVYSLSQYTARVQFPDLLERPRVPLFASVVFRSKFATYFYCWCALGWVLGIWLLRGRARTLVLAGTVSAFSLLAYATAFLYSAGRWWLPVPIYIEHTLFPLFWTAAIAGYWVGLETLAARVRGWKHAPAISSAQATAATAIVAVVIASVIPAVLIGKALKYKERPNYWYEPWPNEPELRNFLGNNIGLRADPRFRGSALFYTFQVDEFLTLDSLWVDAVPTANEYSQLTTPQAIYFVHQLFKRDLANDLNWFRPWINTGQGSFSTLFRAFRGLGVRYVGGYGPLQIPGMEHFPSVSFPRRSPFSSGLWVLHEIPDVNVGNYSPTDVTVARSAADTIDALASPKFDFSRQAVLSTEVHGPFVPARDMQLSVLRGGLHVSGRSDGTSLVVLPQQFSNCLRPRDERVRLVRADLILTGVVFSGSIDTDISFDYGIFSPGCRRADFADMKQLGLKD